MFRSAAALLLGGALSVVLLSGCATIGEQTPKQLRGFNAMQHGDRSWSDPAARRSVQEMRAVGANAVVLIAFLEQDSAHAETLHRSDAVTLPQLRAAIRLARRAGMRVILKPQLLVKGAWAGDVQPAGGTQWSAWFSRYSSEILAYARFAQAEGVDGFVVGTELKHAADRVDWPGLIRQVRSSYRGLLTYAAHNVDGLKRFPYWPELDVVSLTLYPSLGLKGERAEMEQCVAQAVESLRLAWQDSGKPLWVLEIGMPSAAGAAAKPWAWQGLKQARVDLRLQRDAIDIWLTALDKPWVDGIFVWAWYSDNRAGGVRDTDYTPQHKPAERVIRRHWKT